MIILYILLGAVFFVLQTWAYYLAVMNLMEARDEGNLTTPAKVMGYAVLIIGYPLDIILNVFIGSILFLELPKDPMFTSRVSRWYNSKTWRGTQARFWCHHFLDPFEEDLKHCNPKK